MDQQMRAGFIFLPTDQDGSATSAFAFDRRIRRFQRWRRHGHRFNDKRRRHDLEGLLLKGGHCCNCCSPRTTGHGPELPRAAMNSRGNPSGLVRVNLVVVINPG
jgi:hypothetical protein